MSWAGIVENAVRRRRSRGPSGVQLCVCAYGSTQLVVPPVPATPRVAGYWGLQTTSVPPPFPVTVASKVTIDRSWISTPRPPLFVIVVPPVNLAAELSRTLAPPAAVVRNRAAGNLQRRVEQHVDSVTRIVLDGSEDKNQALPPRLDARTVSL